VLVAYHAMLVTNIIDEIETVHGLHNITITGNEAQVIKELYDLYNSMTAKNFLEYYHDALEQKEELFTLFDLGFLSLEDRAKGEVLFWEVCDRANNYAKQVQVKVGQDRRKAVGVLQLDLVVAEPRPQAVVVVARGDRARKQSSVVDSRQLADVSGFVEHLHRRRLGQEHPHHRLAALIVPAEIIEGIVVMALDDRARRRGNSRHDCTGFGCTTLWRDRMRQVPSRGTCSHAGRFINSYSIS